MIPIRKPYPGPAILNDRGKAKALDVCRSYEAGVREFAFDRGIYAHPTVKNALLQAQNRKCCFCENLVSDDGDVEHFRPKGGWCQGSGHPLEQPGYYWLAYEWSNLFLACGPCNSRHKRNLFPLVDEAGRCRSHLDSDTESPLFVNPEMDDPHQHLHWTYELPIALTFRGEATIGSLKLDRLALNDQRTFRLEEVKKLLMAVRMAKAVGARTVEADLNALLTDMQGHTAPFSACVKAYLRAQGFPSS